MRSNNSILGLELLLAAGIASGSFTFPMKFTRRWAWENTWLVWTIVALILLPLLITPIFLPQLREVYSAAGARPILVLAAFGLAWGAAQVFFGLAVDAIGMALAFSIVPGISLALGSLIPLIRSHSNDLFRAQGLGTMIGVALTIVGVLVCARAGARRDSAQLDLKRQQRHSYALGLTLAISSGFGSAMANLALVFGAPIVESAVKAGANPLWASHAAWLPMMLAGALPNASYCLYRLRVNHTAGRFAERKAWSHWFYASMMAILWFGSMSLYGTAISYLGSWGTVFGWPLFMSLIVITASVLGMLTGEWKRSGRRALAMQLSGVSLLVLAVFELSAASHWL